MAIEQGIWKMGDVPQQVRTAFDKLVDLLAIDYAFSEIGLFGNQDTVCKTTTPKWSHTVNRLKQV